MDEINKENLERHCTSLYTTLMNINKNFKDEKQKRTFVFNVLAYTLANLIENTAPRSDYPFLIICVQQALVNQLLDIPTEDL